MSMTEISIPIPGLSFHTVISARALSNSALSDNFYVKAPLLSDNSIFRASLKLLFDLSKNLQINFNPSLISYLAPTINLAPSLSLIGNINFVVDKVEINFIKNNYKESDPIYSSLSSYENGVKAIEDNDDDEAIKYFNSALAKNGNFAEAYVALGQIYSKLGDLQTVMEYKTLEEGIDNHNTKRYLQQAKRYHEQAKKYQERAIENYNKAMEVDPKLKHINEDKIRYIDPLLGRATVYVKLAEYEKALDDFNTAIDRNPNLANGYIGRAAIYIQQGELHKALADLNELIIYRDPKHPVANFKLGSINAELKNYQDAIQNFTKVIDNKSQDAANYYADAYYKRGIANLNLKEYQKAVNDFREAIKLDNNYVEAYYNQGVALAALGDYTKATEFCQQALNLNPDFTEISNPSCTTRYNLHHEGMFAAVNSVAISPDGKILASGSDDKTIKLWNIATGEEIQTLTGHSGSIRTISFSPDGKILASGSSDKTIKLWDIATGEEIQTLTGHSDWIRTISFSPDGKTLASGSDDKTVKLWDIATGEEIQTLGGRSDSIRTISFSPDGKILASGSDDKTIKLWKIEPLKTITITGHYAPITTISFSPDGKILASGSDDKTIKLWDLQTGTKIMTLYGHLSFVESLAFSPDSKTLVSGGYDKTVKVWSLSDLFN
ncbi:MAG: tetratricopeptide repeat protein [Sphaerospermopsis kisseleviana]